MPNLDITCDNCGSHFSLDFIEDEVSYSASHCPFCGDVYSSESEELDFNEDLDSLDGILDGDDDE